MSISVEIYAVRVVDKMHNISRIIILLVVLALIGGVTFLAMWDMPAPTTRVEKVIPNANFAH